MKHPCNNDLLLSTRSAACFAALRKEISEAYAPAILQEAMDACGCSLHLRFLSEGSFPLERFRELTRRMKDPTLTIRVVSTCGGTMQSPNRYEYERRIWMWREDGERTTIAVPDDLCCCARPD